MMKDLTKRDIRQEEGVDKWFVSRRGSLQYATGVGKTQTCVIAIRRLMLENPAIRVLIVVPTIGLKEQWEGILQKAVPGLRFKVFVINTIVLQKLTIECDLLVLDEIHRLGADTFYKVFDLTRYSSIMGLTATMERLDGKEELLLKHCPIVDSISLNEARAEGYVANYKEYNLGLEFSPADKEKYDQITKNYNASFAWFHFDMDMAFKCMSAYHKQYARENKLDEQMVLMQALKWNRNMQARKELLYNNESKFKAVCALLQRFPTKTITFSESVEFVDRITQQFPGEAVSYHSALATQVIDGKKMATKRLNGHHLDLFKNNERRIINTAKSMDQGVDVPDVELGIICSGTSSKTQNTQRVGRICRKHTYEDGREKKPTIIHLYMKDTQEEKSWLPSRQKGSRRIQTITSIDEIIL